MATIQEYVTRRVQQLLKEGWTDHDIIQQLEAVTGRKLVVETLAKAKKKI